MNVRVLAIASILMAAGCGSMSKMGRIDQYVAPSVDGKGLKRLTLISGGNRGDRQVLVRARERLTAAGITLVRRPGEWSSNEAALKDICTQRPENTDNVDGVIFLDWDSLTLHDCASGTVATNISGSYAGIDALVDRLIRYLGATPPETKSN